MKWDMAPYLMCDIIRAVEAHVPEAQHRTWVYMDTITAFEEHDFYFFEPCFGIDDAFDKAYYELYPEDDEE